MIVIVEGIDGVGKTTLAKEISKRLNYKYIHESYTDDIIEKEARIVKLLERIISGENYMYDRTTLIDDFVYSFLNQTTSTLINYSEIIIFLLSKCHIFHLELNEKKRLERFNSRGDEYVTNEDMKRVTKNYKEFYSCLKNVDYIVLHGDLDKDVELLEKEILYYDKGFTHRFE